MLCFDFTWCTFKYLTSFSYVISHPFIEPEKITRDKAPEGQMKTGQNKESRGDKKIHWNTDSDK